MGAVGNIEIASSILNAYSGQQPHATWRQATP
jgi:hypothetical protein